MTTRFTLNLQALVAAVALATCAAEANGLTCFGQGGRPASAYAVAGHVCTALAPSSVDSDGDGVCDYDDAFPGDPCESVDAGDGKTGANLKRIRDMTISLSLAKKPIAKKAGYKDWSGLTNRYYDEENDYYSQPYFADGTFWGEYYDTFYGERYKTEENESDSPFFNGEKYGCPAQLGKGYGYKKSTGVQAGSDIDCFEGMCYGGECMVDAPYADADGLARDFPYAEMDSPCVAAVFADMLAEYGSEFGSCAQEPWGVAGDGSLTFTKRTFKNGATRGINQYVQEDGCCAGSCEARCGYNPNIGTGLCETCKVWPANCDLEKHLKGLKAYTDGKNKCEGYCLCEH